MREMRENMYCAKISTFTVVETSAQSEIKLLFALDRKLKSCTDRDSQVFMPVMKR